VTATVPLSEVAEVNPRSVTDGVLATDEVDFFPMAAVDADKTVARASERRALQQVSKGFTSFLDGDVLIAKITPCFENGKISQASVITPVAFGSTEFHVVRCGPKLHDRYLLHFLRRQEIREDGERKMTGSGGQRRVPRHFIESLEIPLPPFTEQRRIAAILDKADSLRTKRRESLAQLDRLAQSIFVEMFGDLFTNTKGFPVSRLGDCCDVRDGTHDSPSYVAEGYPLVTSKNLRDGKIDLSDVNFISEADYNEINRRSKVDAGDILMPMIGTIGNPVLVDEEPAFAIKNMALIKFKPESPQREFVLQFLRSDCFDGLVASKNKGGTQKFLALGEIRGLPLPVPEEASQTEFSKRIHAISRKRTCYEQALDGIDCLFSSLQHRAFRGEL
jgi:type I restriction enzyme S subunit